MKKIIITSYIISIFAVCAIVLFASCSAREEKEFYTLGAPADSSKATWVYLCGLIKEIFTLKDLQELQSDWLGQDRIGWQTIDNIGKELNITFLAILPKHRCPTLWDMFCWPSDTKEELQQTFREIHDAIGQRPIAGYIGFSNGGFFLNDIAQQEKIGKPIISIGAAGHLYEKSGPENTVYLLISKADAAHYDPAVAFYQASKESHLRVILQEYEGGHMVPYDALKELIKTLS